MLCHFVLAAFAFFLSFAAAQNFETGDNSTVRGCSNHCSYKDGDLECWNKTLVFFERILLGQMRNYVAVQMNKIKAESSRAELSHLTNRPRPNRPRPNRLRPNRLKPNRLRPNHQSAKYVQIDQWRQRNVHPYKEEFERAKRHSVNTMIAQLHPYDVIDVRSVETLVNTLVDLAALQSNNSLLTWMPHVQCPIPCEHRYTVWRNLFILSSVLNVCLFIAILPLVKRMHNGDSCESLIQRA